MKVHIKGCGAEPLRKAFQDGFEGQLSPSVQVSYDWSTCRGAELPRGWEAIQRALEASVVPTTAQTPQQEPPEEPPPVQQQTVQQSVGKHARQLI